MRRLLIPTLAAALAVSLIGCAKTVPTATIPSTTSTVPAAGFSLNPMTRDTPTADPSRPTTSAPTTTTTTPWATGEREVVYPDGMSCVDSASTTVVRSWARGFPPTPGGEPGYTNDPGPIQVYSERPVTVGGTRFDVLTVGCGEWSDATIRTLGGQMAHPWIGGRQRKLLVYHVADNGTRDHRTDSLPFTDWAQCELRPTPRQPSTEVACDASSLPDSGTVVAHIEVSADGKAIVAPTGNVPTGNSVNPQSTR